MSPWVEPFFDCGECGGQIGLYPLTNRFGQEILDWRHRTVPEGTEPHRAILGTPAHGVVSQLRPIVEEVEEGPRVAPPSEMPARPALHGDLPGPAVSLDKLGAEHDWEVQAWVMRGTIMDVRWKPLRVATSVVLWLDRDGVRIVATWITRADDTWEFDAAWRLTRQVTPLNGSELKAAVKYPRALCEDCGKPPALHDWTNDVPVCEDNEATPTKEVALCSTP